MRISFSLMAITVLVVFFQNCGTSFESTDLSVLSSTIKNEPIDPDELRNTPPSPDPASPPNRTLSEPLYLKGEIFLASRLNKILIPHNLNLSQAEREEGFKEQFNRYYTDPQWLPSRTIYVSPNGTSSIATNSIDHPSSVAEAIDIARAGDMIFFKKGTYHNFNVKLYNHKPEGTYEAPLVFYGERESNGDLGVHLKCIETSHSHNGSCFNLEQVDYIAIDGFDISGGKYGIRAVGGYRTLVHQKGIAILNNDGHNQCADPFFTGESDWIVIENNKAHHSGHCPSGKSDGHGIYLSNGGDWGIIRANELYSNMSSDFQINADPMSMCDDGGYPDNESRCDGSALIGHGEGVSEFYYFTANYFHNGERQGPNMTSVRNSVFISNVFAFYGSHGFTFWQESGSTFPLGVNPNLGSSYNLVKRNLFLNDPKTASGGRHALSLIHYATHNEFIENIIVALNIDAGTVVPDSSVVLVEVDSTSTGNNQFSGNCLLGGDNFDIADSSSWPHEIGVNLSTNISSAWFANFPYDKMGKISDWNINTQSIPVNCPALVF